MRAALAAARTKKDPDMTHDDLAQRLVNARHRHQLIATLEPERLPPDAATAYAIQQAVIASLGKAPGGCGKIGAARPRCRVRRASPGALVPPSPARVERQNFFRVLVELEIAFRFAEPLAPRADVYSRDEVLAHVGQILPTIEIVDSRFAEWPNVAPLAQLADFQNNGALITGHAQALCHARARARLCRTRTRTELRRRLARARSARQSGRRSARLLVWFVNHCAASGITIEPEWTITTGSYVGAHRIEGPGLLHGHIDGLGRSKSSSSDQGQGVSSPRPL
jgi:2-keto-4-pentenoate hydratase